MSTTQEAESRPKQFFEKICHSGSHKGVAKSILHFPVCIMPHPEKDETEQLVFMLVFLNDEREDAHSIEGAADDGFSGDSDALYEAVQQRHEQGDIHLYLLRKANIPKSERGFLRLFQNKPLLQLTLKPSSSKESDKVFRIKTDDAYAQRLVDEILDHLKQARSRPTVIDLE